MHMLLPRAKRLRALSRTCRLDAKELRSTTMQLRLKKKPKSGSFASSALPMNTVGDLIRR